MDKKVKISSTAYRVMLLLRCLNDGHCKPNELNNAFSSDPYTSRDFSREVILKYINTLRMSGYNIAKPTLSNNYRYELNKSPVLIEIDEAQLKNIAVMFFYAERLHQNKIIDSYNSFLKKIKKILPESQVQILNNEIIKQRESLDNSFFAHAPHENMIKKIESFIADDQRVSIKYKLPVQDKENQVILELKNIKYEQREIYVTGYNPITEQTHSIMLSYITDIKQLPTKSQYSRILTPMIFKLKGRLAKAYRPYEHEKITPENDRLNSITVTSYTDDKEMLFKRLLKYGENCEVIYPKHARNDMIDIINETLKNYA